MNKENYDAAYRSGFIAALRQFGIYKDDKQVIGARNTDINDVIQQISSGEDSYYKHHRDTDYTSYRTYKRVLARFDGQPIRCDNETCETTLTSFGRRPDSCPDCQGTGYISQETSDEN